MLYCLMFDRSVQGESETASRISPEPQFLFAMVVERLTHEVRQDPHELSVFEDNIMVCNEGRDSTWK